MVALRNRNWLPKSATNPPLQNKKRLSFWCGNCTKCAKIKNKRNMCEIINILKDIWFFYPPKYHLPPQQNAPSKKKKNVCKFVNNSKYIWFLYPPENPSTTTAEITGPLSERGAIRHLKRAGASTSSIWTDRGERHKRRLLVSSIGLRLGRLNAKISSKVPLSRVFSSPSLKPCLSEPIRLLFYPPSPPGSFPLLSPPCLCYSPGSARSVKTDGAAIERGKNQRCFTTGYAMH